MSATDGTNGRRWGGPLALFGEMVITGVVVAALAAPLVTALPALTAGTAHLRRQLAGESVRMADLWRDFTTAVRELWPLALGAVGAALVLLWNLSLAQAGVVPGSSGLRTLTWLLLLALAVLLLRAAADWRPGAEPRALLRTTAERAVRDPGGSTLLAFAWLMCTVFVWMLPPLLLLTGGLLSLAALAIETRRRTNA
ncbi:hypothetical protein [Streptomyces sp. NBRC 109706]|uniref:hypothetical protein n=1 Tax=Streptomyces sp. NBRC 109706 TaxID=1550035 RepID=UPI0007862393|nr:hypothetical protein [Streptomyces sp. NBRC 109706]